MAYKWNWTKEGRMAQVMLTSGEDIAHLAELDQKHWAAISMPTTGVRFDARMLELMDTDGDGRIRTPEVIAAIEFLKSKKVDLNELLAPSPADEKRLAEVLACQADLAKVEPSGADKKALADWTAKGTTPEIAFLGAATAAGEAALAAVEPIIDGFFAPPEDMPLVTEAPDLSLPLRDHLNPKHLEAIMTFAEACAKPVLGADVTAIDRVAWKKVKAAFAPYRAWVAAKPVMNAGKQGELVEAERLLRYKLHLFEFLENYVSMRRLYTSDCATFQMGTLRIDAKELSLCFHVASEAAHSALAGKSECCVIYLKLTRPSEKAERAICAVVTAGAVAQLYVGRNGVFYDRDGKDWDAVITKVVENQVSLMEAFWAPWRKLGEGIGATVKKFLGAQQCAAQAKVDASAQSAQAGGAAMASSVAAIGIGLGMVTAAAASLMAIVSQMNAKEMALSVLALILVISLPSVILTWFKLRKRDLGAILNAGGWAINRPMHFSMRRARAFTKCASNPLQKRCVLLLVVLGALAWGGIRWYNARQAKAAEAARAAEAAEVAPPTASAGETAPLCAPVEGAQPAA